MTRPLLLPSLLQTGSVCNRLYAIRDKVANFYVLKGTGGLVCFDAGCCPSGVTCGFETLGLQMSEVVAVFLTHSHWDHARCAALYSNAQVFVGERETTSLPWTKVRDKQKVNVAGVSIEIFYTPGHTRGSVSYLAEKRFLFSGDTVRLQRGEVLPFFSWFNRDGRAIGRSIRRLAEIDGVEWLLTPHTGVTNEPSNAFRRWRVPAPQEGR